MLAKQEAAIGTTLDVLGVETDERVQYVETGHDAGVPHLVEHLLHVVSAVRIRCPVLIVSTRAKELAARHLHQAETTSLGHLNMALDVLRRNAAGEIYRRADKRVAPVLDAARQAKVSLKRGYPVEYGILANVHDHDRACTAQFHGAQCIGTHEPVPVAPFRTNLRVGRCREHADSSRTIPLHVEPFAKVRAVLHRQLHDAELLHRRRGKIERYF